ncbi:MAG: hypothetical protein AAGB02_06240 [Pseudomonadota bacterium]
MSFFVLRTATFSIFFMLALFFAVMAGSAIATESTAPPLDRQTLIKKLQNGGNVLIIRHERTEVPSRSDDYSKDPDDCTAQRNLSIAGAAGAQETGVVLRALDIEVDRVFTSPMCRSAETARYMFGVDYEEETSLMHHEPGGPRTLDIAEQEVRGFLANLAPDLGETNIALVTHGGTVFRVSGLRLSEGEIAVLRLGDEGDVTVIGHFMGSDLAPYARQALEKSIK